MAPLTATFHRVLSDAGQRSFSLSGFAE